MRRLLLGRRLLVLGLAPLLLVPLTGCKKKVAAPAGITCDAHNGKADLSWTASPGAVAYRVFRGAVSEPENERGSSSGTVFADPGLVNGVEYQYVVTAVDAQGRSSADSSPASCTPLALGEGTPPPAVGALTCRAKNDKVDVAWSPVAGASFYRVLRAKGGEAPVVAGEVAGSVLADFGLTLDQAYRYTVVSVSAGGAGAVASPPCDVTPRGRVSGNAPPVFTSQPLTSALEDHYWYTQLAATDPDGDAITYSLVSGPFAMASAANGFVSWTPGAEQVGPHPVQVRATDARGAYADQAFVLTVADFNTPPTITSMPGRSAKSGAAYAYDVNAFDPEGKPVTFAFLAPVPTGMTIDPATGLVSWTPTAANAGKAEIVVRAADPDGGFDTQTYALDVYDGSVEVLSPKGTFEVRVGATLELPLRSNQPLALFSASPLPAGATANQDRLVLTPPASAVGEHLIAVQARVGEQADVETITVHVTKDNHAPTVTGPGPQSVAEGGELAVAVSASDADGDALVLSAAALPANSLFNALTGELTFRPGYDQAGSYAVEVAASDGVASQTATITIEVTDREPPVGALDLVVDKASSPTFQTQVRISGNVVGDAPATLEPEPFVAITGLAPVSVRQGRSAEVTITGLGTEFAAGQSTASFGAGIIVESLEVLSPTQAKARISAAADAVLGSRTVRVAGNGPEANAVIAFQVEPGATVLSGVLVDSFTQQPLANARIVVNGTGVEGVTDAQGRFRIEGVPAGAHQVLVVTNDYKVKKLDVAFEPNADVTLPDPVGLDALARPFQPGGTLPRAATLASVIDRGVTGGADAMTQEQAEALVQDTILAVGGRLVGVLDESGAQLNPQVEGFGVLSLRSEAVTAQAKSFVGGGKHTLREIAFLLENAFTWVTVAPDEGILVNALQAYANDAWANPNDPLSTMAILLLNQGTTLTTRPPTVTGDTTLNDFQAFLLVTSVLLPSAHRLEQDVDTYLISEGIDPDSVAAMAPDREIPLARRDAGPSPLVGALERFLAALGPEAAYAQSGGGFIPPPNDYYAKNSYWSNQTFTRVMKYGAMNFLADVTVGNAMGAVTAACMAGLAAITAGASGGVLGVTVAGAAAVALFEGVKGAFIEKLLFSLALAIGSSVIEPGPPIPERSYVTEDDKIVIEFEPSVQDHAGGPVIVGTNGARYTYELYDFPDPFTTDMHLAGRVVDASLTASTKNPEKMAFSFPRARLRQGVHYFRMSTIQYLGYSKLGANQARSLFQYDTQLGVEDVNIQPTTFLKGEFTLDNTETTMVAALTKTRVKEFREGALAEFEANKLKQTQLQAQMWEVSRNEVAAKQKAALNVEVKRDIVKADRLGVVAVDHSRNGGDPFEWDDPQSRVRQRADAILEFHRPGSSLEPDTQAKLFEASAYSQELGKLEGEIDTHEKALNDIDQFEAERSAASRRGEPTIEVEYDTVDGAGRPKRVKETVPTGNAGLDRLEELARAELDQQSLKREHAVGVGEDLKKSVNDVGDLEAGPGRKQYERVMSEHAVESDTILKEKQAALDDIQRQQLSPEQLDERVQARGKAASSAQTGPRKYAKGAVKGAGVALKFAGYGISAKEAYKDTITAFQVIHSQLSPAFMYVHNDRDIPPYTVEPHPNFAVGGVVVGRPDPANDKGGLIDKNFFDDPGEQLTTQAGFPPYFLSVDSEGRIYANNYNSNARFGGRIFRYDPFKAMAREFVGSVMYYSATLQYSRPASPISMTAGYTNYGGRATETLFIADVEYSTPTGATQSARPLIRQLPIGLTAPGQPYASEASRNHLVGQEYVSDPRFRFDGPTDMASFTEAGVSRLYVSDGPYIFLIKETFGSGLEIIPLVHEPGRKWSGLALDDKSSLYFVDYETGSLFWVSQPDLLAAETVPGSLLNVALPIMPMPPRQVYDIEIDDTQVNVIAAMQGGPDRMRIPLVLRLGQGVQRAGMSVFNRDLPAVVAVGPNDERLAVIAISENERNSGLVDVYFDVQSERLVRVRNSITLDLIGPTVVDVK